MKILITGAGGFIGSSLLKGLQQHGKHEVVAFARTLPTYHQQLGARWIQGDLKNAIKLDEKIDYIVHCAAVQDFHKMPVRKFIDANLAMTENVARFAKTAGVKGVVFTSSISLHGEIHRSIVDENTDKINPTPYGLSKHLCELLLKEYREYFPLIALRLCGVIGPGAKNVWLSDVLLKAKYGEAVSIVNADKLFNNLVHTDDLLSFMLKLLKNGFSCSHAFPIASKTPLSIKNVVTEIIKASNSNSEIIDNGVTDNSFTISNDYAISEFQYSPSDVVNNLRKFAIISG